MLKERRIWTALLVLTCQATCVHALVIKQGPRRQRTTFLRPRTSIGAFPLSSATKTQLRSALADPDDDEAMRMTYLDRIGISRDEIEALTDPDRRRSPDLADLQRLLTGHLFSVPFENMDQHSHPADEGDGDGVQRRTEHVPRRDPEDLPSLDVRRSLSKICHQNRGGFCYELNLSFAWLLRSLGFAVRLAVADVGCSQNVPAHVIVLVDGLVQGRETPVLVDVGFGNPGVCNVVLPLVLNEPVLDMHGDSFRFVPCTETDRFDTALYRTRLGNAGEEEAMYRFRAEDDLPDDAEEFALGLHHVLNDSPFFNGKRICVVSTDEGHCTLGEGYAKWVEQGQAVRTVEFGSETEWREALSEHFGVML